MIFPTQNPLFLSGKFLFSSSSFSSSQSPSKSWAPSNLIKLGITPSIKYINLFLSFLLNSQKSKLLLHLFSQISSNPTKINSQTRSVVARCFLQFEEAKEIITHAKRFGFVSNKGILDSIIQCLCVEEENPDRAFYLLNQCIEEHGILPSFSTFRSLVLKFCSNGCMERAIEVLGLMRSEKIRYTFDNFICSSVISGYCRIKKPGLGLQFYAEMEKRHGFRPNLVTCTALVDAFCREGRIDDACEFVRAMEDKGMVLDAVLYSSWICGYFKKKGALMEGLRKHWLMVDSGILPDVVSYTNLIDGFCKEGNVEKVIGFLSAMEQKGMKPNLITYSVVLQGFCLRDKLEEAFCLLKRMKYLGLILDEYVYAILIDGLCWRGDLDRVFGLLEEMQRKEIKVGLVTYNTVINGLCKAGKTSKADEIASGFIGDNFTYSTLLHGYSKEMDVHRLMETKRRLEEAGIGVDLVTFNVLIKALFMIGMNEDACVIFKELSDKGLVANSVTYCTMIDGLCKIGKIDEALEIFEEYRKTLPLSDASCHMCIIRGLCKEQMVEMAIEFFKELAENNLVSDFSTYRKLLKAQYIEGNGEGVLKFIHKFDKVEPELLTSMCNDALVTLCRNGGFAAALAVCIFMRRRRLSVSSKSYYFLLKCLICSGNKLITELIMCDSIKVNGPFGPRMTSILSLYLCKKNVDEAMRFLADKNKKDINVSVLTTAVDTLKKKGRAQDALAFLMEAEKNGAVVDVVAYSIVVDGLCKEGYLENALDLCAIMRRRGIHPNNVVYNSVINGLCHQGCIVEALRIFDSLELNHVIPTVTTYAILIGALSREGFLEDAEQLFRKMFLKGINPNTRIYNSLIYGYSSFGLVEKALATVSELEQSGLQPDAFTISAIISGYCQKGDTQGAYGFFNEYKRKGSTPDFLGFLVLVEGLFIKRRMKEARDVLRDMLQCEAVVGIIDRASREQHVESLVGLLNLFCEQGRIQEAICVLSEVGSEAFPSWRSNTGNRLKLVKRLHKMSTLNKIVEDKVPARSNTLVALEVPQHEPRYIAADVADMNNGLCNINNGNDSNVGYYKFLFGESLPNDFDAYYSIIASLCSKGELMTANCVVKEMLLESS